MSVSGCWAMLGVVTVLCDVTDRFQLHALPLVADDNEDAKQLGESHGDLSGPGERSFPNVAFCQRWDSMPSGPGAPRRLL